MAKNKCNLYSFNNERFNKKKKEEISNLHWHRTHVVDILSVSTGVFNFSIFPPRREQKFTHSLKRHTKIELMLEKDQPIQERQKIDRQRVYK